MTTTTPAGSSRTGRSGLSLTSPGRELYAYFNNSVGGQAVGNAGRFRELLGKV